MNYICLCGRLTRNPEVRYGGSKNMAIASFSLAVDRRFKREGQPEADFFNCSAFGKTAEFIEKYLQKGSKIIVQGELQNNHYQEKDGHTQYAERVVVNQVEFAESKKAAQANGQQVSQQAAPSGDDFMNIPDTIDESLPFV